MKYTDEQLVKALENLLDDLSSIQTAEQIEFKGRLDCAIDDLTNEIVDTLRKMGVDA